MKVESGTSQLASWQLGIQGERVAVFTCLDALSSGYLRFQVMVPGSLGVWGTMFVRHASWTGTAQQRSYEGWRSQTGSLESLVPT